MDLTNVVVRCPTEELAKKVLKRVDSMGYKWCKGTAFLYYTCWKSYKENSCYRLEDGMYGCLDGYIKRGYKVITSEEFLNDGKD